jgi:excisionase family DNA binding protein
MTAYQDIIRPSKKDQKTASDSLLAYEAMVKSLKSSNPIVDIEETKEKIRIPKSALELLSTILKAMSEGHPVSIVPVATEFTTQAAAEFLGCSRPHIVKLLEEGKIPFTKIGRHRRIKFDDLRRFKTQTKENQQQRLIQMMKSDEESELYGA